MVGQGNTEIRSVIDVSSTSGLPGTITQTLLAPGDCPPTISGGIGYNEIETVARMRELHSDSFSQRLLARLRCAMVDLLLIWIWGEPIRALGAAKKGLKETSRKDTYLDGDYTK